MAVIERIPLHRAVAVVRDDSIAVRPGGAHLLAPVIQALIAGGAIALIVGLFDALPIWLLMALLVVAIVLGPAAVLGLVYNVYGNEFLIERPKQSARWHQGFLGLGIGTAELVPFARIAYIEVRSDEDAELSSGQRQDFVQLDVVLVKDNERDFLIGTVVAPRALLDEGLERANRLARFIGDMTGSEVREATPAESVPDAQPADRPPRRRRRRVVRRTREA